MKNKKLKSLIKKIINESLTNKEDSEQKDETLHHYDSYKQNWMVGDIEDMDLYIEKPFSIKLYNIQGYLDPDDYEEEIIGFFLELLLNNSLIGRFQSIYDNVDGETKNDIYLSPKYQNLGLGKVLTLLAIEAGNISTYHGFVPDNKQTIDQRRVYDSLIENKLISGSIGEYTVNHDLAQQEINKIVQNFVGKNI
jgi:hypothetical protein